MSGTPRLLVLPDAEAVAQAAADIVVATLQAKPDAVIGLATGATMERIYERLAAAFADRRVSFAQATGFNLDEYLGLGPVDRDSFAAFMHERLAAKTDFGIERMRIPDGRAADPQAEARRYEAAIAAAGGIDLQLLGLGTNGHVAFNEPGSERGSRTRIVSLAPETREANAAHFGGRPVPERAITMGIATILDARRILLVAKGEAKAAALAAALEGPVGPDCPASWLRAHPDLTVICDDAAAAHLASRTP